MKRYCLIFLLLFTAACTTIEDERVDTILSMARSSSITMLEGKTVEQVRDLMGNPTFVRKEAPNESWVFKAPDCALFVFFDKDGISTFTQTRGSCDKRVARRILEERKNAS
ncbi:MAG: hypothetical protein J6Y03_04860 [Alphaproteobacteria bacterium]|nr:hypothetical protein [Alphaproteobacteria bacterium]